VSFIIIFGTLSCPIGPLTVLTLDPGKLPRMTRRKTRLSPEWVQQQQQQLSRAIRALTYRHALHARSEALYWVILHVTVAHPGVRLRASCCDGVTFETKFACVIYSVKNLWSEWPTLHLRHPKFALYIFASHCYSSHMTASSSALWSRFSPPSNFVNGHVSTMWFMVCRWPESHVCKLARHGPWCAMTWPYSVNSVSRSATVWLMEWRAWSRRRVV